MEASTAAPEADMLNQGPRETLTAPPWGRLLLTSIVCIVCSGGLLGGMPLWIDMVANEGVYSSFCEGRNATCVDQTTKVAAVFAVGGCVPMVASPFVGFLLDKYGGRALGTIGPLAMAMCFGLLYICILEAEQGRDKDFNVLFAPAVFGCQLSGMFIGLSQMSLLWHFAGYQAVFFAVINAGIPIQGFIPMIMLKVKDRLDIALSTVILGLIALLLFGLVSLRLMLPTQDEFYARARLALGNTPPPPPGLTPWVALKGGLRRMSENKCDWFMLWLVVLVGTMEPWMILAWASDLGKAIFGTHDDGQQLASGTIWINAGMGMVSPLFAAGVDVIGISVAIIMCLFCTIAVFLMIVVPSWPMQYLCQAFSGLIPILVMVVVQKLITVYAPPREFGTVQGSFMCLLGIPAFVFLASFASLPALYPPGPDAFVQPLRQLLVGQGIACAMYLIYILKRPPPSEPPCDSVDESDSIAESCTTDTGDTTE